MSRVQRFGADRTNQKIYFTRLACKQARQADTPQLEQAAREAAVFHLYGAYQAFLQELAHFYNLNIAQPSLLEIKASLARKQQVSPEINILEVLVEQGYLAELTRAFILCQQPPKAPDTEQLASTSHIIVKTTSSLLSWLPSEVLLTEWRGQLQEQINQFRVGMLES